MFPVIPFSRKNTVQPGCQEHQQSLKDDVALTHSPNTHPSKTSLPANPFFPLAAVGLGMSPLPPLGQHWH